MMTLRQKLTRYSGSLLLVLAAHTVAIIIALRWSAPQIIEFPPAAMLVQLAPRPAASPMPSPIVVQSPQLPAPVEETPLPKLAKAENPETAIPKPVKPKTKPKPPTPEMKPKPPPEEPVDPKPVEAPLIASQLVTSGAPLAMASPPSVSNAQRSWQSDLQNHLAKYQRYPEDARRRNISGSTHLRFDVGADGKVISVSVAQSSGHALLDRATLTMIRQAQPLPKPPAEILRNGSIEVTAPFDYSLENVKSRF
ncbi:energy transducer TonB [Pseudomonas sp. CCC3.2]|uniref:energy transducer TonB n=1 Tax=unclassified Pseudomonas TaxID=196821 RepID=UPI002AB34E44|nr:MULTISPECIES: energy transducer TonB [unclassified Pseudomonas]MDY7562685.1 energy transducer TonB [Pseudomonas sp. AB6]MEA9977488.1 energy transducer TonB [Pseudomonas sp. RTS4]MEB0181614.1 energy transducer TonB [Pseudomonas sp. CCC3.2]MEB0196397.1 energy transducer TonB [Pseudomonas sp. 5S4]MEB0210354.1 energy transducer TonB [Pseudomonas sp. AB6]